MTTYFLERLCASSASASASAPASASNAAGKRPIASNATAPPIAEVTAQEVVGEAAVSKAVRRPRWRGQRQRRQYRRQRQPHHNSQSPLIVVYPGYPLSILYRSETE